MSEEVRDVAEARELACRRFLEACGGDERAQVVYEESAAGSYATVINKLASACNGSAALLLAVGAGAAGYSGRVSVDEVGGVKWELEREGEQRSGAATTPTAANAQLELPTDARFVVGWLLGSLPPTEERALKELARIGAALDDLA